MFAACSQLSLVQESGSWVVPLTLNKVLWLAFLIFALGIVGNHPTNSQAIGNGRNGWLGW